MGYARLKRASRRVYRKMGRFVKKRYFSRGGIRRLVKDVSMLKTAINVEKKYWDRVSNVPETVTVTAPLLLALPWDELEPGTEYNQRVGQQVKALWTTYRATIRQSGSDCSVRILVVHDREPRGAAALGPVALRDALLALPGTPHSITSPYRVTADDGSGVPGDRFNILFDKVFRFDNVNIKQRTLKLSFDHTKNKHHGMRIKYRGLGVNEPLDDRLYILALSDTATADNIQFLGGVSRMCFVDN